MTATEMEAATTKAEWKTYLGDLGQRRGHEPRRHQLSLLKGFLHQQGATSAGEGILLRLRSEAPPTASEAAATARRCPAVFGFRGHRAGRQCS